MPGFVDRVSDTLGRAVGIFLRSQHEARFERRPGFISAWAQSGKWNGGDLGIMEQAQRRAMQNSWVFQDVGMISREISAGRLEVVEFNQESGDETVQPGHDFIKILRRPNPFIGRSFLWQYTTAWLELDGNAYWFLGFDEDGYLAEIWPLPSNMTRPFPGDKERFIDYYEFTPNGQLFQIPSEYICHFLLPNPFDIFRGMSPLVAAMLAIDADLAMSYWNGKFFGRDNVMPSAIINLRSGDPNMPIDPADKDALEEDLKEDYAASQRKTLVTTAPDGVEVNMLAWSPKDMDFLNGRQFTKDEIHAIYGIPGGLFDKNATEANAQTADRVFKEKTIWPLMGLLAEQITAQVVVPLYGRDYETRYQDIRPTNRQLELQEATAAKGAMTIDEYRERFFKLPPLPSGDGKKIYTGSMPQTRQGPVEGVFDHETEPATEPSTPTQVAAKALLPAGKPANGEKKGAMIALFFPPGLCAELALTEMELPEGSRAIIPDELHLTVTYLGEIESFGEGEKAVIDGIVQAVAQEYAPFTGMIGGIGRFANDSGDGTNALYTSLDAPVLSGLRQAVIDRLDVSGIEYAKNHGFTPHITLAYLPIEAPNPQVLVYPRQVEINNIALAWGADVKFFSLTGFKKGVELDNHDRDNFTHSLGPDLHTVIETPPQAFIDGSEKGNESDKSELKQNHNQVIEKVDIDLSTQDHRIEDEEAKQIAMDTELRRWRDKAIKAVRKGDSAAVSFYSTVIPADVINLISTGLQSENTVAGVKAVFAGHLSQGAHPGNTQQEIRDNADQPSEIKSIQDAKNEYSDIERKLLYIYNNRIRAGEIAVDDAEKAFQDEIVMRLAEKTDLEMINQPGSDSCPATTPPQETYTGNADTENVL